jgi:hypothetical protein
MPGLYNFALMLYRRRLCLLCTHIRPPHDIHYVDGHSGVANLLAIPAAIPSTNKISRKGAIRDLSTGCTMLGNVLP